ncbi:hypothetical protein AB6A40_005774 [Gnathostoma spinigerum]|uniref:Zn-dependent metallo-hydrolase RNA specificity domain-containing protein n=1 Tax=Gnathostoma spinigerum TaxID=75299 RepID=A0ABD6ES33_9BILA
MPGFCVAGTVGAKVVSGAKKIEIDGKMMDINLGVEYMSFSAHADAKGIMQLIRDCQPRSVMFVHGENAKMEFLKEKVEQEFNLKVYKPANGETVVVPTLLDVNLDIPTQLIERSISLDPSPSKRFCPFRACILMDKQTQELSVISSDSAAKQLGFIPHSISFSDVVHVRKIDWKIFQERLVKYDPNIQSKEDGLSMFDGELLIAAVSGKSDAVEVIWDEMREQWSNIIIETLQDVQS